MSRLAAEDGTAGQARVPRGGDGLMARPLRMLAPLLALAVAALVAGFYVFANAIVSYAPAPPPKADAIVVLTGTSDRVSAGIALITAGRGRRLLISGVNRAVGTSADIRRRFGGDAGVFQCCVDVGHQAMDTIGNAHEARDWVLSHGYASLIIVTSSYHMPRSLAEFSRAMPQVKLVPYPVPSRSLRLDVWWQHRTTLRLLAGEYVKFLASAARLGFSRLLHAFDAVAGPRPPVDRHQTLAAGAW